MGELLRGGLADLFAAQYEVYAELANPEDLITEREYFEYVMTQGDLSTNGQILGTIRLGSAGYYHRQTHH